MEALKADYASTFSFLAERKFMQYQDYLAQKFQKSQEIMAIAYKAKAMVSRYNYIISLQNLSEQDFFKVISSPGFLEYGYQVYQVFSVTFKKQARGALVDSLVIGLHW